MASLFSITLFLIHALVSIHVLGDPILEQGYTVTTLIDGHKLEINPHLALPRSGPSDLLVLDSSKNLFYTVSSTTSQVKRFAGSGESGYSDGDLGSAKFNNPKSFAVDVKGNVYVADNSFIRKITNSGVTTIAGGFSKKKVGHVNDGPAQNASFSDNLELAFVPESCAILISDRGHQLVHQLNLRPEDCARGSQSALGATSIWILGLGVSCLLGLIIGFAVRPYIVPHEGSNPLRFSEIWRLFLINLGNLLLMHCFGIRSAIASSTIYKLLKRLIFLSLSHLSLMFRFNIAEPTISRTEPVSLLDSDHLCRNENNQSQKFADQLKDLMNFNGSLELLDPVKNIFKEEHENQERSDTLYNHGGGIDNLIQANITGFVEGAKKTSTLEGSLLSNSGLVKRR